MSREGSDENWVEVALVPQDAEADLIRGFLESEGIEAVIDNRTFHMEPVNFGDMTGIRILTRAEDADRSRQLLEQRRRDFERLKTGGSEESILTDSGPSEPPEQE
jgi:Putative prokaryotic signal transducing protein